MEDDSGYLKSVDVLGMTQNINGRAPRRDPEYINIHQPHLNPGPTPPHSAPGTPPTSRTHQSTSSTPLSTPPQIRHAASPSLKPRGTGRSPPITPRDTPPLTPQRMRAPAAEPYSSRNGSPRMRSPAPSTSRSEIEEPAVKQRLRSVAPSVTSPAVIEANDAHHSGDDVPLPTARKGSRMPEVRFNITEAQEKDRKKKKKKKRISKTRALKPGEMHYGVEDVPPWYSCILLAFQHYLIMFGATVSNPLVIAEHICIGNSDEDAVIKSHMIGTIFFISGISTLLQTTVGVRLPIIQGGSFSYVTPIVAMMSLPQWKCPDISSSSTVAPDIMSTISTEISTINTSLANSLDDVEPPWMSRIREVQGAIMVASVFQMLIGFTGLVGLIMRFIGPLSVAPTIALIGLALFKEATRYAAQQWWIALVTVVLIAAFSQYTKNINVPCFHFKRGEGCKKVNVPIFRLFPVILAVSITWIICAILIAADVFPDDPGKLGYGGQTNVRIEVLNNAPWFRVPYPGQWGMPTVSVAAVFGMFSAVLASIVESVGDYYACARLSSAPPPPMHAVNRGIGIEGITCVLAGAWGSGSGTTSYSENIGAIGITRVASRRVVQVSAFIMIIFGVFGKFGAIFVTIPEPIIGGVFIVMFGMIAAVGISNLQFADLNSSRNLFIIGFSFFFGLSLPAYLQENAGVLTVGVAELDQILTVLLNTSMFVGGLAGFVLDNTIPGTDEERGLTKWRQILLTSQSHKKKRSRDTQETMTEEERALQADKDLHECYDLPLITNYFRRKNWARYIPFLPTFDESLLSCRKRKKGDKDNDDEPVAEQSNPNNVDSGV